MKTVITEYIHEDGVQFLKTFSEVKQSTDDTVEAIVKYGKECDALLVRTAKINAVLLDQLPNLKIVSKHGVGVDNIEVDECTKRGIKVCNAPLSNRMSVAEHTIALILAISRKVFFNDKVVREGRFHERNTYELLSLEGKTVGVIGLGNIGKKVIELLKPFGVKVIGYDLFLKDLDRIEMAASVNDLFRIADIVTLHVPLTEETKNLVSKEQLELMNRKGILVSLARGGVVNEEDLYNHLKEKRILGAGLDVFEAEPPLKDNKLFTLDNIILSPHNAALTDKAKINMAVHAVHNLKDYYEGKDLKWAVN